MPQRYTSLDLWRGIACIIVVIHHSALYAPSSIDIARHDNTGRVLQNGFAGTILYLFHWGWLGVPMFFVISGFCIAASVGRLLKDRESGSSIWRLTQEFMLRRFIRIYPPYLVALLLAVICSAVMDCMLFPGLLSDRLGAPSMVVPRVWNLNTDQVIGSACLIESWRFHFGGSPRSYFLGHAWTLCYEEQFYVIVAIGVFLVRREFYSSILLITVAVILARTAVSDWKYLVDGFCIDGYWLMFALGIAVYAFVSHSSVSKYLALFVLLQCVAYAMLDIRKMRTLRSNNIEISLLAACLFAVMMYCVCLCDDRLAPWKGGKALARVGRMSYSIYLVHWIVARVISYGCYRMGIDSDWEVIMVVVPICTVASICAGWGFFIAVEERCVKWARFQ